MTKQMTWKEFKEHVEKKMKEKGISQDEEIWYVDSSFPGAVRKPEVNLTEDMGISIHN